VLMWRWFALLSFRSPAEVAALTGEVQAGRNPKDAKVMLARELVTRFHSASAADAAEVDFVNRSRGGIPDEMPELSLQGAPLAIGALLRQAGLVSSGSEALRMVEQGGVRIDGVLVSDKALKVAAGTLVLQVGKRKFARVTLSA
jgi:tyrosyl-tRNA synthetase